MAGKAGALKYQRILFKLSGEMLGGDAFGLDADVLTRIAEDVKSLVKLGVSVAIVVGGGNFCRGSALSKSGLDPVVSDQVGMLATMMNAIALTDSIASAGLIVHAYSAKGIPGTIDQFSAGVAKAHYDAGSVLVLAGGTGNPFFTTDTAASLRAIELQADIVLKATKVDGVYSADPVKDHNAERYDALSYDEVLRKNLRVMDLAAICLCKDHKMPLRVFDLNEESVLERIVKGENVGTLVS